MTNNIKQFIEENITTIEQQDWQKLFEEWYSGYFIMNKDVDYTQLQELFNIFSKSEINLYEESEPARQSIIIKYMNEYIKDQQFMKKETVTWAGAVNSLHSRLGFTLVDTMKLFRCACDADGLYSTDDNKIRYKLI